MPKNKDFKRLVRARMKKTGESYTAARARLVDKRKDSERDPRPSEYATLAGMRDEVVAERTGRSWREWVRHLDGLGAASMPHREIVQRVSAAGGVSDWWSQMVTVGYERIKGLREIGQRRGGTYDVNKSRTLPVPVGRLYRAFRDARLRRRWLTDGELEVRKATPEKSMRCTWEDGLPVDVYFTAKGEEKSRVSLQHRKLPSKDAADRVREEWSARLAALADLLT